MAALSVDGTPMPALPNSADQINYDNTTSGLSATTVKGAVDELASEKQDATDNNLTTTDKTIVGGINELKSGLIVQTITDGITPEADVTLPSGSAVQKMGGIVAVNAIFQKALVLGQWNALGTVGSGYRPPRAVSFSVINSTKDTAVEAKIDSAGVISVWPTTANSDSAVSYISVYIVYFNS